MIVSAGKKTQVMVSDVLKCVTLMKLLFVTCIANANTDIAPSGILLPYQTLYVSGVEAYMKQRWKECVTLISKAITDHRSYRDQLNTCRYSCKNAGHLKVDERNFLENIYLDAAQKQSICIKNCTEKVFPNRRPFKDLSPKLREVELHFQNLDPYDYLQMCAFKAQQFELAFSAAFTFAIARPNHPYAGFNLDYYRKIAGDKVEMFKNLELKLHQELRYEAVEVYENSDWIEATDKFETSLASYLKADAECEAECDSLLDDEKFSEFYRKVTEAKFKEEARYYMSNHWLKLLNCRESCTKKLATVNGVHVDRFFLDHFHYLQYCYYKIGNPFMAARSVASFLLFNPNDPNQMYNKIFYKQQGLASEKDFVPRQDAQNFYERKSMDLKLKKLAEEEFLLHRGLGGQKRVVADGLANTQDCQNLIELANIGHSEKINRVTVSKAAEMVRDGKASATQVGSLMQVSDKARHFLENFYNLKVPLLFQRTQLTFREDEAKLISGIMTLDELDGCYNNKSIFCIGYKGRDFVAYIYLDNGSEKSDNGTFHFEAEGEQSPAGVEPKLGRMFSLTIDDKHHLDKVVNGHSYALIIWFTLSPADQELDHAEARTILRIVEEGASRTSKISLASLDFMRSKRYSLSFDEEDLNGPERFAADGLASEEECRALIRLTNSFGSVGSGYGSGFSHTRHESFTGVTVDAATEVGGYVGDGYEGRDPMFPHTKHEVFEGLNVLDAAELAQQHKVSAEDVQLYLRLSNDMRELTRRVLVGDVPLYFSFTHLVCRTALNDENLDRTDLSHPIHSDNCIIQDDNTCKKVRPAYTERDYSAILYLNDDFFGGDFFFAHQNMSVQSRVKPKCGRVVSFNSGHYHGVKPVLSGQRCAVAIWFTLDPEYDETSHLMAQDILNKLEKEGRNKGEKGHLRVEL